jgi:hypothetical protein
MKPRVIAIQQSMKKNLIKAAAISLILLTYSIVIDAFLAGRTAIISLPLKLSTANSLAVILGSIILYLFIAIAFKLNFTKLLMGKAYNNNLFNVGQYRMIPICTILGLSFSGYITCISGPVMLLTSIELVYLLLVHKYDSQQTSSLAIT